MKLKVFENDPEFIALDLVADGRKDMKLCRDIGEYFPITGLYISFEGSVMSIGYDGTECSFKISKKVESAVAKGLEGFWSGYYKFLLSPSFYGCKFRFVALKAGKKEHQRGLLLGFIPPPVEAPKAKKAIEAAKMERQERIVEEELPAGNRHLFENIRPDKTVQARITEGE